MKAARSTYMFTKDARSLGKNFLVNGEEATYVGYIATFYTFRDSLGKLHSIYMGEVDEAVKPLEAKKKKEAELVAPEQE